MYSPARGANASKDDQRRQIKEQKRNQLSLLLINKFRNKFNVNSIQETEIDRMMLQEIQSLLATGSPTESSLISLDRKLEANIKEMRGAMKRDAPMVTTNKLNETGKMGNSDAKSQRSSKSVAASNGFAKTMDPAMKSRYLVYEDPAASLNVSEEKWNAIVQENLRKFKEDKEKVRVDKIVRAKAIQEEQKKQIQEKQKVESFVRAQERDYFNNVGVNSSDVYYVNADKKTAQINSLRGGAKNQAQDLFNKQAIERQTMKERMAKETDERMMQLQNAALDAVKVKQTQQEKKNKLKGVIENDTRAKQDFRVRSNQLSQSNDFADHSVLSYLYKQKEHKAFALGQKKDYVIGLMQSKFMSTDKFADHEGRTLARDIAALNDKDDLRIRQRAGDRKRLEMEAKSYQDRQVAERDQKKNLEKDQKGEDFKWAQKMADDFTNAEAQKKQDKMTKNKVHLESVLKQMQTKPKMFAKTGVAIIESTSAMNVDHIEKL